MAGHHPATFDYICGHTIQLMKKGTAALIGFLKEKWQALKVKLYPHLRPAIERYRAWEKRSPRLAKFTFWTGSLFAAGFGSVFLFLFAILIGVFGHVATKSNLRNLNQNVASEVYSEDGVMLGKYFIENRLPTDLDSISPYIVNALISVEDARFYEHNGVDFRATFRVLFRTILQGDESSGGGSTISQQLAKNLYLTSSKNPVRKIKETILTWRLERALSKKRIMELYLNVVEWGEGVFGAEMAARTWYGKPASALGPEEAARLAVVLPNPRKYNPRSSSRYVANRSQIIYNIMVRRGIVIPVYEEIMAPASPEIPSGPTPAPAAPEPEGPAGEGTQPHPEVTP